MIDLEEETIMVESNENLIVYSKDYINNTFFMDIFNKKNHEYVKEDFEINPLDEKFILEHINKAPGTTFKMNGEKFLVRNHDRVVWNESGRRNASNIVSDDNVYDTRYASDIPLLSQIIILVKKVWLHI